jgi:hypothetical protein
MLPIGLNDTSSTTSEIQVRATLNKNGFNYGDWEGQLISAVQAKHCQLTRILWRPGSAIDWTVNILTHQCIISILG